MDVDIHARWKTQKKIKKYEESILTNKFLEIFFPPCFVHIMINMENFKSKIHYKFLNKPRKTILKRENKMKPENRKRIRGKALF